MEGLYQSTNSGYFWKDGWVRGQMDLNLLFILFYLEQVFVL